MRHHTQRESLFKVKIMLGRKANPTVAARVTVRGKPRHRRESTVQVRLAVRHFKTQEPLTITPTHSYLA